MRVIALLFIPWTAMPDAPHPVNFDRPPVVETSLKLQFSPLTGFRLVHFGIFLEQCLGAGWQVGEDVAAESQEYERFGVKSLLPIEKAETDIPPYQTRFVQAGGGQVVRFQPNKLQLSWVRKEGQEPHYREMRDQLSQMFGALRDFSARQSLGTPVANLWEISYVNAIPTGDLWATPADWHKVIPGLFPTEGPQVPGHLWGTYAGEWHLEMPGQVGRVRVRAQKVISKPAETTALLLVVSARGELSSEAVEDWAARLDLGHESATTVFRSLASPAALTYWGLHT
jgi:uncharacterized protein (TIGR04255 family)